MNRQSGLDSSLEQVLYEVKRVIVGQDALRERMVVALLARGHLLVEGVPGLAKTMAVKTLAQAIGGEFQRIQFTPDLVPADIVGTRVFNQKLGEFQVSLGPVFANLVLADEINRAPAKVQSALLEAMQEHQVTIGSGTHKLPEPFLVLATQNPIEKLTHATRSVVSVGLGELTRFVTFGASPRASINMILAGRALALVRGRPYALAQDIQEIAPDVLRHRLILSYEALADGVDADYIVARILEAVQVPELALREHMTRGGA